MKENGKIFVGKYASMCDPILRAVIAKKAKADFNIVLGLCVGHDSLFFKYAKRRQPSWRSKTE